MFAVANVLSMVAVPVLIQFVVAVFVVVDVVVLAKNVAITIVMVMLDVVGVSTL